MRIVYDDAMQKDFIKTESRCGQSSKTTIYRAGMEIYCQQRKSVYINGNKSKILKGKEG